MKKGLMVFMIALLAGMAVFCAVRWQTSADHHRVHGLAMDVMPELEWLKNDLHLTAGQLARVRELHLAYRPKCAEMCRRISEAHEKIEAIAGANKEITPEYQAALKEHADLHVEGQVAMLRHLYQTAATLDPEQQERYLKTMLPFALDFSHSEPESLHDR